MTRVDVAVVGAGIVGCMVAREIASREPGCEVVVLERDAVASGASRRSAGLHLPRGLTPRLRRMAAASEECYRELAQRQPWLPVQAVPLHLVAPASEERRVREVYLERPRPAPPGALPPPVRAPDGHGVWSVEGCQFADVPGLVRALADELAPRIPVREAVRVQALEPGPDGVRLRLGAGSAVEAGRVVLAPGPWVGDPAWRSLAEPLGVRVKKVVALHVEAVPGPADGVAFFHEEDAFLLPLHARSHWLFSYTCQEWDVDPDAPPAGVTHEDLEEARACLRRYAPDLADLARAGRVFCDAYSPAREPVVQPLDEHGRVVFAGAANGSGYRLAPAIAAEAADAAQIPLRSRSVV